MYQCPKCGRSLSFKMKYIFGIPLIGYECPCGYNTFKYKTVTSASAIVSSCSITVNYNTTEGVKKNG